MIHEPVELPIVGNSGPTKVTVIDADDLRMLEGVNISRSLSWERTAKDFSHAIRTIPRFNECSLLVTVFGTEGAIVYRNEPGIDPEALLIFDPIRLENSFSTYEPGESNKAFDVFTAELSLKISEKGSDSLAESVARSLIAARHAKCGKMQDYHYATCEIEPAIYGDEPDPDFWRIAEQQTRQTRLRVAEQIVIEGESRYLTDIPRGKFCKLETIDRAEIENYSAIRELIAEYLDHPKPSRPLCIAVFGPPGSGKSFGVKQVMKSLGPCGVTARTFNISQFSHYDELAKALHEVKEIAASGKLPFVFFDEFDSTLEGKPLEWLAAFLAPMNDGEFKDHDGVHSIGKAIFVFAGGTTSSLENFSHFEDRGFVEAKGPDFVSRLRGFINVMGPNRQHATDDAHLLRRALVLRGGFVRNPKTQDLFDKEGTAHIDAGILRAMLHVGTYRHGMRSMNALLDMSRIGREGRFNLASLPTKSQLDLHVDAEEFVWLTQYERYQNMILPREWPDSIEGDRRTMEAAFVEQVAERIFENVIRNRQLEDSDIRLAEKWSALSAAQQQSFRDSAIHIPTKLRAVNHGIRKIAEGKSANVPDISDTELESLARLEHDRRCQYLRLNGYTYALDTDIKKRKSSRLVSFEELPEKRRNHYRQSIYAIPRVLQALGFEIYRMQEHTRFEDKDLLEPLARLVHQDYVKQELARGATVDTNPSLVDFEELTADKIESNFDNAASIPKKLRRLGYRITKIRSGEVAKELDLNEAQILRLAKMEHSRWVWQSIMQGWIYRSGEKDLVNRTNPCILPWDRLDKATKLLDIETVKLIPRMLVLANYKSIPL